MPALAAFLPRDVVVARRALVGFVSVGSGLTVLLFLLDPPKSGAHLSLAVSLAAIALAVVAGTITEWPAWLWVVLPFGAIAMITLVDLATRDASITAQVLFVFPALYAGSQLTRNGSRVLCVATVAGVTVVAAALLPPTTAIVDSCFVAAVLITAGVILTHEAEGRAELTERLREQAAIDSLTGLVTRRVLDDAINSSLRSAGSDGGTALIMVDIDHFKAVNDEFGHPVGDVVLQRVAAALRTSSRPSDVISRMGGDELALLVPGCSLSAAQERSASILAKIRALDFSDVVSLPSPEGTALRVTASIGMAHLPTHALDVGELYRAADRSLYRAKRAGRNRIDDSDVDHVEQTVSLDQPAA